MDLLIKNATIITQDRKRRIIKNGSLAIKDGRIADVFIRPTNIHAEKTLDASDFILIPGLINAHVHLGESIFKPFIEKNLDLPQYLKTTNALIGKTNLIEKYRDVATDYSMMLLLKNGVTAICGGRTSEAGERWGIKNLSGYMAMKTPKFKKYYDTAKTFERDYQALSASQFSTPAIFLHSLNFVDQPKLKEIASLLTKHSSLKLIVHLSETKEGERAIKKSFGKSSTGVLDQYGLLGPRSILVHCNWLEASDLRLIKKRGSYIVHCPTSNFTVDDGTYDLAVGLKYKIPTCLGSDGLITSGSVNLLSEARFAYLYHNRFSQNKISLQQILDMMTILPAKALGLEKEIGSIESGKRADLVFISKKHPLVSEETLLRSIIFYEDPTMISKVMNGGEIKIENGKSVDKKLNFTQITSRFKIAVKKIRNQTQRA
jgi:5-methylthioadenosine/S-adenosylhomocysteine deaminase